jgi:hypothetical protein
VKNVLVISHFFPPHDSTAALEASKFTRYLPDNGWRPLVVAAVNDYPETLPLELDRGSVIRTSYIDVNFLPKLVAGKRRVASAGYVTGSSGVVGPLATRLGLAYRHLVDFPDAQIGWYPFALRAARRAVKERKFDAVLSSAWPITNHLVARRIAIDNSLPWVADFRDLWTDNHTFRRKGPLRRPEQALERRVMATPQIVTTPSRTWSDLLASRFGRPVDVVPNGFDPHDYPADAVPSPRFTLTYTGVWYPGKQDPSALLDAMCLLRERGIVTSENFRLRFVGRYAEQLGQLLDHRHLWDLVEVAPSVSHDEALRLQVESSALLFLLWSTDVGRGWHSAKLYEYLGARRPILAIGPAHSDAARLLERSRGGIVAQDPRAIASILEKWIGEFYGLGSLSFVGDEDVIKEYEWANIVQKLGRILHDVTDKGNATEPPLYRERKTSST